MDTIRTAISRTYSRDYRLNQPAGSMSCCPIDGKRQADLLRCDPQPVTEEARDVQETVGESVFDGRRRQQRLMSQGVIEGQREQEKRNGRRQGAASCVTNKIGNGDRDTLIAGSNAAFGHCASLLWPCDAPGGG